MKRVLIVEDDSWQAEHTSQVLSRANYSTEQAADALSAIDILDSTPFDLILLDVFLPGPNAFTLLHELQSHPDLSKIPVVIFSTQSEYSLETLKPYGVVDVVSKATASADDLVSSVRKALA